jgi:hypothetical protein
VSAPQSEAIDASSGQFIDPLFAIVIGAALNETLITWVDTSTFPNLFELLLVSLGFLNVLLSWWGYHKSVSKKPIRGVLRFSVTILLLPMYLLTIILFKKDILYITLAYGALFLFWAIWEWLKSLEYNGGKSFMSILLYRWNILIFFTIIFQFAIPLLDSVMVLNWSTYLPMGSVIAITLAIMMLRFDKSKKDTDSAAYKFYNVIDGYFINRNNEDHDSE